MVATALVSPAVPSALAAGTRQLSVPRAGAVVNRAPLPRQVVTPRLTVTGIGDRPLSPAGRSNLQAGAKVLPAHIRTQRLVFTGVGNQPLSSVGHSGMTAGAIDLPAQVRTQPLTMTGVGR